MAINVDTVYKTVLLVLNKEQRGYITPDEFNKTATQVQINIFEQYFADLNQQLRVPQPDVDYADRQMAIDEKISPFKTTGQCIFSGGGYNLPILDAQGNTVLHSGAEPTSPNQVSFYKLGAVVYTPSVGYPAEMQRVDRTEFYNLQKSDLTRPSIYSPTYLYESGKLIVSPQVNVSRVSASFIRKPRNVVWNYSVGGLGQYVYDSSGSTQFELNPSEQVNVITRILLYSGIIIEDPQIVQAASREIQQEEINKKS